MIWPHCSPCTIPKAAYVVCLSGWMRTQRDKCKIKTIGYIFLGDSKLCCLVCWTDLNWFMGRLGSNMHRTLNFWPNQPGRNWMYQSQRLAKVLLFNLYTVIKTIETDSIRKRDSPFCNLGRRHKQLFVKQGYFRTL